MTARATRESGLAVQLVQRTGCTPQVAAARYGLAVSTVRRALGRAGVPARPAGRPKRAEAAPHGPVAAG